MTSLPPSSFKENANSRPSTKPLFTLQHTNTSSESKSSLSQSECNKGNDVTSLCFLPKFPGMLDDINQNTVDGNIDDDSESYDNSDSDSDSESSTELQFRSKQILQTTPQHLNQNSHINNIELQLQLHKNDHQLQDKHRNLHLHNSTHYARESARDTLASLSFSNTLLASTHTNGYAYIWDLTKRRVVKTLNDGDGPGLAIGRLCNSMNQNDAGTGIGAGGSRIFHQRRNAKGTISIMDGGRDYDVVQRLECHSQTFCHASSSDDYGNGNGNGDYDCDGGDGGNLLLTPSRHAAFAQLWDLREGSGSSRSIGVIHGAGLDGKDVTHWRDEGMLMSLKLSQFGNNNSSCIIACGMESGNVFFHDLRMLRGNKKNQESLSVSVSVPAAVQTPGPGPRREFLTEKDVIASDMCCVSLGNDPILCLDMCPSRDEREHDHDQKDSVVPLKGPTHSAARTRRSMVAIAGKAADAMELLALPEEERGTVAVIKATSLRGDGEGDGDGDGDGGVDHNSSDNVKMRARVRAQVGTCKLSNEISREGKPGVGVCRFRPDGKLFAVGGWDKRIRLYSRTSAKLLSVLRGSNDGSISALAWSNMDASYGRSDDCILAAGSSDGKISLWRAYPH